MSTGIRIATGIGAALIALIGYLLFIQPQPPVTTHSDSYAQAVQSLADFDGQLARVALAQLGNMPGLGIRPTDAEVPIGTLFIPGRSLDLDEDACRVDPAPASYTAGAFPDFTVQDSVAASVGLSPAVTRSLASAGAQLARGSTVTIHFDVLKRQYLDDHKLAELLKRPACLAALSAGPVSMIRGYFRGQRSFILSTKNGGKLDASLSKVANFDIARGSGDSSVTLKDAGDFGFLQLYTQVAATPAAATTTVPVEHGRLPPIGPMPAPGPPRSPAAPSAAPGVAPTTAVVTVAAAPIAAQGRVYLQRDVLDDSHADGAVAAALTAAGFPVVPKVEAVPSRKMPTSAQVRYFNATDLAVAVRALALLRASFPGARLVRVALPSPSGQLEVWLPKAAA